MAMVETMASAALTTWRDTRLTRLARLEAAKEGHLDPVITAELGHAYVLLLAAQFQAFCRDLHSEGVDFLVERAGDVQQILKSSLTRRRRLDSGNPTPGNIGSDFTIIGVDIWPDAQKMSKHNIERRRKLESLNAWRNIIAHGSSPTSAQRLIVGDTSPTLTAGKRWRSALNCLASDFDAIVSRTFEKAYGASPW